MKVLVWPADEAACGHYRLIFPAQACIDAGYNVEISWTIPSIGWDHPWDGAPDARTGEATPGTARPVCLLAEIDADVVVFQRLTRRYWIDLIPLLQEKGIRVVVDVDDRFDRIPRRNVSHKAYEDIINHHEYLDRCCQLADVVTVTTPALAKRYGHGHGVVLPNLVPARYLKIREDKFGKAVGWAGFIGVHAGDLDVTEGAVAKVIDAAGWDFAVVGPFEDPIMQALRLRRPALKSGWVPIQQYPHAVSMFDVGIVPLQDNEFNAAKSCLKAMEMASLGVPCVMSPTPDNLRLHRLGVGLVASSRGQWARQLGRLVGDKKYRDDVAAQSFRAVERLTYEERCGDWWETWTGAVNKEMAA